jgi:hypothetical protein
VVVLGNLIGSLLDGDAAAVAAAAVLIHSQTNDHKMGNSLLTAKISMKNEESTTNQRKPNLNLVFPVQVTICDVRPRISSVSPCLYHIIWRT